MKTSDAFFGAMVFFFGSVVGNFLGDQATIKDCASTGAAEMLGGGNVKCEVLRTAPPKGQP